MKSQGQGTKDKGQGSLERLVRTAIRRVDDGSAPPHDLWPAMQARLQTQAPLAAPLRAVPWFDWALAVGLAIFALIFPAAVPMLLYYL